MKIIHTSDWHLGASWNGIERTEELFAQVDCVFKTVKEQKADVLLVAGDVFDCKRKERDEISKRLARKIKALTETGCHAVLIPGNHDDREHFAMMKTFLELESGKSERIHIVEGYEKFEIEGVQFICLPYPDPERLEEFGKFRSAEKIGKAERNKSLSDDLAEFVGSVAEKIDPSKPAIFVTHLQIIGVKYDGSPREASYNEDISLSSICLPRNIAYIALGHIHKCQQIEQSAVPCWYSGSFDRMDLGEREGDKFVLLVEIDEQTKQATVEKIAIDCNRFDDITVSSEELEEFAAKYENREKTYGNLNLRYTADDDTVWLTRRAQELFPRFRRNLLREDAPFVEVVEFENPYDPKETVRQFLEKQFGDDKDLAELIARANELIAEVEKNAFEKN
ncbi:MAG TPA: exonuclease SbcCD subunit D [Pyrinomonadaceae bacterium]|jgi:exonuclease SbcD